MKLKSTFRLLMIALGIFVIALFLPELKPSEESFSGVAYKNVNTFLADNLGFNQTFAGASYVFVYSILVAFLIWIYYHIILMLRMIAIKEYDELRDPEIEGLNTKLFSLSRFRLINIFFGKLYKVLAFAIFMTIVYNIPILNRIIYVYTLGFWDNNFWSKVVIMSILLVVLPKIVESFLWESRKTRLEKGLVNVEKMNALIKEGDKAAAKI